LLLPKNGKDFYNDFKHIFNYMSWIWNNTKYWDLTLVKKVALNVLQHCNKSNVWNDRFLHGGLANATSSSWNEVSKWECVQPSYGVTRTWYKD
jgi:hypothetical protein